MIFKKALEKLVRRENLSIADCGDIVDALQNPIENALQVAALLALLRAKPETVDELTAIVNALRNKMRPIATEYPVLDIVGTGGDGLNSVNISTGSALLAAACGVKVAKHGNRAVSSSTGSADVLEALGINIELTPERISQSIHEIGIGFCYSPYFHATTQALRQLRKALNIPTTFNVIGPLLNPAKANHTILGVMDASMLPIMADVLINTGCARSAVVHSMGLDEISCAGTTQLIEINNNIKTKITIHPRDFGLSPCRIVDLKGGSAHENAALLLDAFKGKCGAIADSLILNAGVALYLYGQEPSIHAGVTQASKALKHGAAFTLLNKWIEFTNEK